MIRPGIKRLFRLPIRRREWTEQEVDEEIRLHVELRAEQLEGQGLSREEAQAEAWRRFDPEGAARMKQAARRRDTRLGLAERISGLRRELRYVLRSYARQPLYALGVSGTLGLGVTAALLAFAVAWQVWLAPLPYPAPDRLVRLHELAPPGSSSGASDRLLRRHPFSPGLLHDFRSHDWRTLESLSGVSGPSRVTWRLDGEARTAFRAGMSPEGLRLLGVAPILGRYPVSEREVLLSERFWRSAFGADSAVIGATMRLGSEAAAPPVRIVGVGQVPAAYPGRMDLVDGVWAAPSAGDRGFRHIEVIARIRPGHTPAQVEAEAAALVSALAEAHPEHTDWSVSVARLKADLVRPFRGVVAVLHAAGLIFLLLSTVNVMGMVAARRIEGRQERSIRKALGASEARLLRGSLLESGVLAATGTAAAVAAAYALIGPVRMLMPADAPRIAEVAMTAELAALAVGVGAVVGLLLGVVGYLVSRGLEPAVRRAPVWRAILSGGRPALVIGQVALIALILSAGTAILHRAATLRAVDLGFEPEGVTLVSVSLPDVGPASRTALARNLIDGLNDRGVRAAMAFNAPLSGDEVPQFGMRRDEASEELVYEAHVVSADYFAIMGIELLAGRVFADDVQAGQAVVVSDEFVRRFFPPGTSPRDVIGRSLPPLPYQATGPVVAGVARATHHHGPDAGVVPEIYAPLSYITPQVFSLVTQNDPARVASAVGAVTDEVVPGARWDPPTAYTALIGQWYGPMHVQLVTIGLLSGLGLLLASLGLYAFMAYQVVSRRKELGIRKALGARDRLLVRGILARGLTLAAVGTAIGLAAWYRLRPWIRGLIEEVDPGGGLIPVAVLGVIGVACVIATLGPALRATRIDPAAALKVDG